jgi:tRNA threonylcarbamoyladenosine biosynthesis protein TsaB
MPRILALDTATNCCSVALRIGATVLTRETLTDRGHGQLLLPMIDALLAEAGASLRSLDAIAFGRGPGAFTGVRLAASVTQGLAFAADLPVLPVSDLRAVALRAAREAQRQGVAFDELLACQDARMREVYCGRFVPDTQRLVRSVDAECVQPPGQLALPAASVGVVGAGSGLHEYAGPLAALIALLRLSLPQAGPRALDIVELGCADFALEGGLPADAAQPVYLRDDVAQPARAAMPAMH